MDKIQYLNSVVAKIPELREDKARFLKNVYAGIPELRELQEAEERLADVLPAGALAALEAAAVFLLREGEGQAAGKLARHFFTRAAERKAFMRLVQARLGALTFGEAF